MTTTSAPTRPSSPAPAPRSGNAAAPPEWAAERLIKWIGKGPTALGKQLDKLAKAPIIGPVIRLFSSVVFGLIILALIAIYIAIGSGLANLRASLEMTDLQFFDAWPMRILLMLLATDLIIVTLRRIPMTLFKLGPWIVHTGILTLITGSVLYFGLKQEGQTRIYLHKTVDSVYDTTERALYAFHMDSDGNFDTEHALMIPMPGLPYFYEHDANHGNPLDLALPGALATWSPTLHDATVHVFGYYPSVEQQQVGWREGEPTEKNSAGPAIALAFDSSIGMTEDQWLFGNSPANRILQNEAIPFAIEYLYHPTPERLRDLQTSFDGPMGITVRIPGLKIERTYAIKAGETIAVEGSPYTLTPGDVIAMPMASKGYENTQSSAVQIKVARKNSDGSTFEFTRMPVFRFPERTPDFVTENGKQVRKQDGVDPDIQIIFHDATKQQFWVVEDDAGKFSLIGRSPKGKSTTVAFGADQPAPLQVEGLAEIKLKLMQHTANAVPVLDYVVTPPETRKLAQSAAEVITDSMIELRIDNAGGPGKAWSLDHVKVPFVQFAQVSKYKDQLDPGRDPTVVEIPGVGTVGLLMSTVRRELPTSVTLKDFRAEKYPGAHNIYLDYYSTLEFVNKATGQISEQTIHLNNPGRDHGMTFFQAAWDGKEDFPVERKFSVVGIGNRPGVWGMIAGAALIVTGIGYAFYAKPVLLKKKKEELAAWAASRKGVT